jgi:hypothetical protein
MNTKMQFTATQQQEIMQIGELLRNRDILHKTDFNRMLNKQSKMHPSDYMRHYTNAAKIIMKCSEELSKLEMHPDATPRTYLHWLSVMLGIPSETFTLGSLGPLGVTGYPGTDRHPLGPTGPSLDRSTAEPVDYTAAPT